ncbi:hypothetical protein FB45DRAFT_1042460 [Roridomyces roridus]|uniref:CxC2-like cysteine cluster KDZ transposase-associated domain-containing protein n=1 Tax=Roridomyces roridus TaxID=1738132 RepID=A0AAD7F9I0_9AGAR|nr:hypothetical protein FB45DRAFT_1042460 [Roridomyces roridus]
MSRHHKCKQIKGSTKWPPTFAKKTKFKAGAVTLAPAATVALGDSDSDGDSYTVVAARSVSHRVSADGQRVYRQSLPVAGSSPVKRQRACKISPPSQPPQSSAPVNTDWLGDERYNLQEEDVWGEAPHEESLPAVKPSDEAMARWKTELRDAYLDVLLWRDGHGKAGDVCPGCTGEGTPLFRCDDCCGGEMLCGGCCVSAHARLPLHRICKWNGAFFARHSLKSLGLRVQLGHHPTGRCAAPHPGHEHFVVLHDNGFHEVAVDFCGCEFQAQAESRCPQVLHHHLQLLRFGWYPSTDKRPQTCATFVTLDRFMLCSHQSKMTAYDFYCVLERLTDNTGVEPPDRYEPFLRMARQWRHLHLLKRAGRGHASSDCDGTAAGELALLCPVCQVNLPDGFENAAPENQCLYVMVLALDACFQLKHRLISSEQRDPGLGTGLSYVVEPEPYREYLKTVTDQKEMSTCSGLAALDYANTKFSRGYATTGVVMGVCARHEFVQPNGVGDLQKGERFANTDWVFASILRHLDPRIRKIVSYDIVCQWAVYVIERLKELPPLMRLSMLLHLFRFVIPKMHIRGHTVDCQVWYSLNYVPGSGQTDGEGIERPWANIGGIATSTRVSGPGARHDALDCHWSFWNWLKTVGLPKLLRRRLDVAKEEEVVQEAAFKVFTLEQRDRVPIWQKMVEEYEADGTKPNPYESTAKGLTEAQVRMKLEEEEEEEMKAGKTRLHDVSPCGFISLGLELEDSQRKIRLQAELKKRGSPESSRESLKQLRRKFTTRLTRFRTLQATYQPSAIQTLTRPLPPHLQISPGCMPGLAEVENALREGQCRAALVRLRNQLHIKAQLLLHKQNHSRHQAQNTRSRAVMAWQARLSLMGGDEAAVGWPRLRKADIRCMEDAQELAKKGEKQKRAAEREQKSRREGGLPEEDVVMGSDDEESAVQAGEKFREVSWIWAMAGTTGTDVELDEALRIEWAKAWARCRRWTEERRMLEEEWRRLSASYIYREGVWEGRGKAVPVGVIDGEIAEGKLAYAVKQAQLYRELRVRAEAVRADAPLRRGQARKRSAALPLPYGFSATGEEEEEEGGGLLSDGEGSDGRGDVSEEELLMGGEVDD